MALFQSGRERLLGGATALAVLFGGGYLFVFKPAMGFYAELDDTIAAKKQTLEEKRISYEKAQEYRARFDRMRDNLSFESLETEQEKKDRVSKELIEILDKIGIVTQKMSQPESDPIDDQFRVYRFKLSGIRTNWPILATLLYEIETSAAVLEVSSLKVTKFQRGGPGEIQVDLEISRLVEHKVERRTRARGR
jgi:hypothetical protein